MRVLLLASLIAISMCAPREDIMPMVPGYPKTFNTSIYSGYLATGNASRQLHYVFVESINGANNKDPVTLWLNGGPGCSSMLGFLQEIGPYYLPTGIDYKVGDNLVENPHSWHKASNLLFLQSPAGVGYSINLDTNFSYTDAQTANDSFNAVLDFFKKYPEYKNNGFWIAGESYAGKYIPDLTTLLDKNNLRFPSQAIKLRGFLIGNGIMDFTGGSLYDSQIEYMIKHDFVDPDLVPYWKTSCQMDPNSAGCNYFLQRYEDNIFEINVYSVYDYCYYNDSFAAQENGKEKRRHMTQESILKDFARAHKMNKTKPQYFTDAPCAYFDGVYDYFNKNEEPYHAKFKGMTWNGPCAHNVTANYHIDLRGSMDSYRYLLTRTTDLQMILYNGEWDSVVPYIDTIKNIKKLYMQQSYLYTPWFTNDQHSGFWMVYSGVIYTNFKGAGHMVPQDKRAEAYKMFKDALDGHSG